MYLDLLGRIGSLATYIDSIPDKELILFRQSNVVIILSKTKLSCICTIIGSYDSLAARTGLDSAKFKPIGTIENVDRKCQQIMEGMSKHRRLVLFGKSLDSPTPTRSIHVPRRRIEPVGGSRELFKLPAFIPPVA